MLHLFDDPAHQLPTKTARAPKARPDGEELCATVLAAIENEAPAGRPGHTDSWLLAGLTKTREADVESALRLLHHRRQVEWLGGRCYRAATPP